VFNSWAKTANQREPKIVFLGGSNDKAMDVRLAEWISFHRQHIFPIFTGKEVWIMNRNLIPFSSDLPGTLRREMDSLFNRFFDFGGDGNGMSAWNYEPHINLAEQADRFEVTAELPGMKPEDFSVEVKDNQLWISGEKKEEHEENGKTYHRVERRFGSFQRVIPLTSQVNPEHIAADYKDGVLTVRVPKAENAKPKRIPIKS
jgi:HSP20 family protein